MGPHANTRILCLGDSLTEGYSEPGADFTPYGDSLKAALSKAGKKVDVVTDGESGDQVTAGSFGRRMTMRFDIPSTRSPLYDWVLLLGGTNDIGWGKPAEVIHDALVRISDIPLSKGAKVLLFTIPETAYRFPSVDARRAELNHLIMSDARDDVFSFDLHAKIPYHSLDEETRKEIWSDGLHLTPKGYEWMGKLVAERLINLLEEEEAAEAEEGK